MTMYKCLTLENKSWYDGTTQWMPGKWMPIIQNGSGNAECGIGYHLGLSINNAMQYGRMPCRIWEAEGKIKYGEGKDKKRYGKARITKEITPKYVELANEFIQSIENIRWFSLCKRPLKSWKLYKTRNAAWNAAGKAAWKAARKGARKAAWKAARKAARKAAENAAWNAAWDAAAAWNAAGKAAWNAAWNAANDAALMAQILICDGLKLDKKHILHAKRRWNVWQRGYGLLCDVNGVLYVYEKP